jgi:hypothetical protein
MPDPEATPPQPDPLKPAPDPPDLEEASSGPSLTLLYSLIGLALLVAIGFALLIVAPFHHRHSKRPSGNQAAIIWSLCEGQLFPCRVQTVCQKCSQIGALIADVG